MSRVNVSSGAKWESIVGYSRAVRIGSHISISGTTAVGNDGQIVGIGDPYQQTIQIMKIIQKTLEELGASIRDVTRTRMYATNIEHWKSIAKAHAEYFGEVRPATTLVEVNRLIQPDILVEIEAEAIVDK